ncbi:MAG: 30S ribosomal protein S4 [Chlamydiae bacterium GWC2_50_10]|nr:MAG: 30S ribosomal protein S4 [Chlamydiae bacterium GWA2_50_15]OGN54142.1 MAG: 30S ribosomal protein S4 [Chlamydiae bacterium GWC2_50_10]OGN54996.1 MAG: 30S ribosomal protein S4 [Chlamydiae bacterium GWF2_49_8]OGN57638.1 MAG: 30S ribosomal protein S4 [Chlamydiae bacterium RIFCSPHIGHO2_02_FULL_49_29]OGN64511.1 MAG: 30S ribosomal protein S4 [Chlamydiae bacterium RIFCSPHIGHO2_12_FULL_49_32]OGN70688.1 MAG: 30S ribosomal protein S4 [Chlamydiae bacterium RIFCSPLOWO2_02_FULL_49_12]OGN72273.1 MAG:
MVRYTGPKNRIARRFGANIFGYARNPLLHKPNPPGMHGARRKKKSDFGMQLDEQQKLKAIYGMLPQKQLVRAYNVASRSKGNTLLVFMQRLECRLDNIVYRLKFAPTIFAAQQLVSHGHVLVDGKKVDRRSFLVEPEMTVSLKPQIQKLDWAKQAQASAAREIPEYLSAEEGKFSGKLLVRPETDQIPLPLPVNIALVCDFLAHIS